MPFSPLKIQPTQLLGRAQELEFIRARLTSNDTRLLTLTGPAGVGKTRLALAAGSQLASAFPDGTGLIDLTPVQDAEKVLPAIARSLDVAERNGRSLFERVAEFLQDRTLLLILDNFDRVPQAASQLSELLARCRSLRMLVTSRMPLHLRWEQTLRIAPLAVPDLTAPVALSDLATMPSIVLYVERVLAVTPNFALSDDNAQVVAELVVRLDGLPLAIELAAARSPVLSPQMLVERLQQSLSLLRWEAQDLPERQQSLSAAIGWSYDLLAEEEQSLFRQLGVFLGGFDLEAAEAVLAGTGGVVQVVEVLASLVDQSMIQFVDSEATQTRYTMLESLREYAYEQLEAHGELEAAKRARADYYLAFAERAAPHLRTRDERTWYLRLDREHDNFRVALRWLLDSDGADLKEMALRLATALSYFWILRGYHEEGLRWLQEVLRETPGADPASRIEALLSMGLLLAYVGEFDHSRVVLEDALVKAQQSQSPVGIARALTRLGARAVFAGEWAASIRLLEEALSHWQELGDRFEMGTTLFYLGCAAFGERDYDRAVPLYSDALASFDAIGNERASGSLGYYLGIVLLQLSDLTGATQLIQRGIRMSQGHHDAFYLALGVNAALLLVGEQVKPEERARLLGAEDALRLATGSNRISWEHVVGRSASHLHDQPAQKGWEVEYKNGRSLHFDDVVTLTLTMLDNYSTSLAQAATVQAPRPRESILSEREMEVLTLVAGGLSSKVIGKRLFISVSTVNYHLTSIFNKLGVDTRAQAVATAAQRGILPMDEQL